VSHDPCVCEFECEPVRYAPKLPVFDLVLLRNVLLTFTGGSSKVFRDVHQQMARWYLC
jgi:hypothetical protein